MTEQTEQTQDSLHSILEHAESLNMPEGDYLQVCNALKNVFKKKEIVNANLYTSSPTQLAIYFDDCISNCTVKSFVKCISSNFLHTTGVITMDITIDYHDEYALVKSKNFVSEISTRKFSDSGKIRELFNILKPSHARIICDDIEFDFTLEKCGKMSYDINNICDKINNDDDEEYTSFEYSTFSSQLLINFKSLITTWYENKYY